jgi:predicted amidohydrolase YtcJ
VLKEPFTEEFISENGMPKGYRGTPYWNDEDLGKSIEDSMKASFDVHIHAMGDASVHQAAKCIRAAQDNTGIKKRNVIAHLMLADDESFENMEKADIIANCQPRWMVYDSDIAGMFPMIGEERSLKAYPLREFLDRKITVAFGTDFPVTPPPDTMHEIQCAMTRSVFPDAPDYDKFRGKVLGKEKPAELKEAVKSLSINGAYQMNLEDITGSIEVGKSADLVILDSNLEDAPVDDIYSIAVEKTIFKGRVVYNR